LDASDEPVIHMNKLSFRYFYRKAEGNSHFMCVQDLINYLGQIEM